jgi:two-component system CheB/CheR fusion protein
MAFNLINADIGRPLKDLNANFNIDFDDLINESIENRKPKSIEVQDRNGLWRSLQVRPYKAADNKIDGAVIALIDIEELKQREKITNESSAYLKSVVESVPFPLVVLDNANNVRSMNMAFKKQFSLNENEETTGRNIFYYLNIKTDLQTELLNLFSKTLKASTGFNDFEIEVPILKTGKRHILLTGRKVFWVGSMQDAILLSLIDVTESRRIEEERHLWLLREQAARNEAEKANRTKDLFLATLSHELRTPLTSILTWAYLIRMGKVDYEQSKQGASVIEKSAKTQSQLIDDLLDISRIISGKLALQQMEVDPKVVIESAIESVLPLANEKAIKIEMILPQVGTGNVSVRLSQVGTGLIYIDPVRLQQIIWNLLTNAVKFSAKQSHIEVILNYVEIENYNFAQIKVVDHGKGISPEFLPNIFSRFSQADSTSTRVHGGLGLGLSIVKNLVEMQGGKVLVENATNGTGCIFTLIFPLLSSEIQNAKRNDGPGNYPLDYSIIEDAKAELQNYPKLDGIRILFVEDDENSREAISLYLKTMGAEVISVDSARLALQSLPIIKPHILISDIAMPFEDGYSLMTKIRKLTPEQGGEVPAIALTAFASTEDANAAMGVGFSAHIAKPVENDILIRTILKLANPI